jgi:hypothetical protein
MIERKLENRGSAPGPVGPDWGPDCPAGRRAISAWCRTGIQYARSGGRRTAHRIGELIHNVQPNLNRDSKTCAYKLEGSKDAKEQN